MNLKEACGLFCLTLFFISCSGAGGDDTSSGNHSSDSLLVSQATMDVTGKQYHGFISSDGVWLLKEKVDAVLTIIRTDWSS
ncbi:MAG: hypothetical protein ACO1N1_17520 [Dyadobacter fermentans]